MVSKKFVDLFKLRILFCNINAVSRIFWRENGIFYFYKNVCIWIKPKPLVKNGWLTNSSLLFGPKKVCQISKYNLIILTRVIISTDAGQSTDRQKLS